MLKHTNWIAEDLCDFISQTFGSAIIDEVKTLIYEKRVSEVYLEPGRVSSRIIADSKRSKRVVLNLGEFNEEIWDAVLDMIAARPLVTAQCYNHYLPFSVKPFFAVHNVSLTGSVQDFTCVVDEEEVPFHSVEAAAVLEKFAEQLISNPFGICTVRGRNIEQIIHELREKRTSQSPLENFLERPSDAASGVQHVENVYDFYQGKVSEVPEIIVRADELPASILKRLDPIPVETPEIEVDELLESAYGRVARLSQSLARFLPQVSSK